jgi:hypothetical protein
MKMKNTWIVIIILAFCACRGERWDDDLTLPKQDYTGNQLRIDGYFYSFSDNDYQIYFLYRNGTVLKSPFISSENLYSSEQEFANGIFYNHAIKRNIIGEDLLSTVQLLKMNFGNQTQDLLRHTPLKV